jgi:lipopolysaccharide export system protein LptC
MTPGRGLAGVAALAVAALATTALYLVSDVEEEAPPPRARPGIGFYVRDARLRATDNEGLPLYDLTASAARQSLQDDSVDLDEVRLDSEPTGPGGWELHARAGRIPPDGKILQLTGGVVGTTRDPTAPVTTFRTDYLEYDPSTTLATTDREVALDQAGGTLHGRGMRANLRDGRLQLLARVAGRYTASDAP